MFNFEKLNVYNEALRFADTMYRLCQLWPKQETYVLVSQLLRAAISISLNIAEGSARTKKDFRHFLDLARGSAFECVAILSIAKQRRYINQNQFLQHYNHLQTIVKMIQALKLSLV